MDYYEDYKFQNNGRLMHVALTTRLLLRKGIIILLVTPPEKHHRDEAEEKIRSSMPNTVL